jgi:hypothetical protein
MALDKLKEWVGMFGHGMVTQYAPRVAGGAINKACHDWKLDVAKITEYVNHDESLWKGLTQDDWQQMASVTEVVGNLDFVTADLLIDSIKKDFPKVASLLINWPEATVWLEKQISDLKGGVERINMDKNQPSE